MRHNRHFGADQPDTMGKDIAPHGWQITKQTIRTKRPVAEILSADLLKNINFSSDIDLLPILCYLINYLI